MGTQGNSLKKTQKRGKVMVFGVFDGCDEGHRYFLHEAKKLGDSLIVVVAQDEAVEALKKKCPLHTLDERRAAVESLGIATKVVAGDKEQYSWRVLQEYQPDVVALGYDQTELGKALEAKGVKTKVLGKCKNKS